MNQPASVTLDEASAPPGALDRFLRRRLLAQLAQLRGGSVALEDAGGTVVLGEPGAGGLHARVRVLDPRFYRALAANGSVGAGGTGNLTENTSLGIARFVYTLKPAFQPLAADLVSIDPGTGSSSARRERLDPE